MSPKIAMQLNVQGMRKLSSYPFLPDKYYSVIPAAESRNLSITSESLACLSMIQSITPLS